MKRTPLQRTGWLRRLWRSKKRQREDVAYRTFKAERMKHHTMCQTCGMLLYGNTTHRKGWLGLPGRYGRATDLHHIIPLSDWPDGRMVANNVLCVCRACHDWIHANPKRSYELGLLKRRERE